MLCPACKVELKMSERQGVEIDYCPQCRGVWLDRGELDKIIERTMGDEEDEKASRPQSPTPAPAPAYHPPQPYPYPPHKYYKKKSLLKELFDF